MAHPGIDADRHDDANGAPRTRRVVRRVASFIVIAVVVNLILGWAISRSPTLAWVLGAASLALLGWAVFRALRSRQPWVSLGVMALAAIGGWAVAIGVDALVGSEPELVAGDDAAAPAASPPVLTPGDVGAVPAEEFTIIPLEQAEPTQAALPDEQQSAEQQPEFLSGDVAQLVVTAEGTNGVLSITPADSALLPSDVAVFSRANPGRPITFAAGAGWTPVGAGATRANITWDGAVLRVTIGDGADDAFAIVVPGGTRLPTDGYAAADGSELRGEPAVAEIEQGFLDLDVDTRAFVASLLGRQLTTGEYRLASEPSDAESVLTADRPRFSQTPASGSGGIFTDGATTYRCDAESCAADPELALPVDVARAIVADPSSLMLTPVAPPNDGVTIACAEITAGPPGLSTGTTCWGTDGRPTSIERADTGDRFVLTASSDLFDESRLALPSEVSS